MPFVVFRANALQAEDRRVEVASGTTLMEAARRNGLPLGDACGGNGACGACHVVVESGEELLSPVADREDTALDRAVGVTLASRLACQARVVGAGEVVVRVTDESLQAYRNEHPE